MRNKIIQDKENEILSLFASSHLTKIKKKYCINRYKMKNKILILAGDPISINSEIIYKSWKKLSAKEKKFNSNCKL